MTPMKLDPELTGGLGLLRMAIDAGDPKSELLLRVDDLLKESRALSCLAGEGWRPIETAPKDGTPVDLWARRQETDKYERLTDCSWGPLSNWVGDEYMGWHGLHPGLHRTYDSPTHWRPLPAAPSVEEKLP